MLRELKKLASLHFHVNQDILGLINYLLHFDRDGKVGKNLLQNVATFQLGKYAH